MKTMRTLRSPLGTNHSRQQPHDLAQAVEGAALGIFRVTIAFPRLLRAGSAGTCEAGLLAWTEEDRMTRFRALLLLTLVAACGSSSGNADAISAGQEGDGGLAGGTRKDAATGACSAIPPAGAVFSWQDNGTPECGVVVEATRMTSSTQDFLEIITGTSTALGVGITVVAYGSVLGGTYNCKSDAGIESQYVDFVYTGPPGILLDQGVRL
jgi:hypothetical protein